MSCPTPSPTKHPEAGSAAGWRALCAGLAAAFWLLAPQAEAQNWPTRPLRLVVAYPPGGLSDETARGLADQLSPRLGVAVTVENRAGAGGSVAIEALARSAPDGQTLVFSAISPLAVTPHLRPTPYDPARDIVPVAGVMFTPVLVAGTPAFPGTDLTAVLEQARARPGSLRWSTSGIASIGHLMLEQLKLAGTVDITHVPYKGGGQQLTDALGGQFELISVNTSAAVLEHVRSGRLRALAVGAPQRLEALARIPTLGELGYRDANLASVFGVFAPGRTPEAVVRRLNEEINRAIAVPALRERIVAGASSPLGGSAADFAARIARESEANARVIRAAGIKAE